MNGAALSEQARQRINQSIELASGLPNYSYTSDAFFEYERDHLFAHQWACVGHACSIPAVGDVQPISLLGLPLIAVRGQAGHIKVFHNVCSHRGNELVWEPCKGERALVCPYHAWTYSLDGDLIGTPHVGGYGQHEDQNFDRAHHGLREVRSHVWMDLIFVNVARNQPEFPDYVTPLEQRIAMLTELDSFNRMTPARDHGELVWTVNANWKLAIENNLESYHLPTIHKDLNRISRLEDHYHFYGGDLFAGQGSNAYAPDRGNLEPFPTFPGWSDKKAEYPTLFPNVFLGFQDDHFWSIVIEPIAPAKTRERLQIYYLEEGADSDAHEPTRNSQLQAWAKVFNEDVGVVEGMQRGRHSPAFEGGVFSPKMDNPTHFFHKWVANQLASGN